MWVPSSLRLWDHLSLFWRSVLCWDYAAIRSQVIGFLKSYGKKEEKANERGKNLFFTQREKEFDSKTLARKWKTWLECFIALSLSLKVTSPLGGFPGGSGGKESVYSVRDPGSVPGSGRSPGEGNGYPLHWFRIKLSNSEPIIWEWWGCLQERKLGM